MQTPDEIDLKVQIGSGTGGVTLKNPVMASSGTFGYGEEFADFFDLNLLGGIFTKAITLTPRAGNLPPRLVETPSGLLNAIGLENVGVDAFIRDKLPFLAKLDTAVFVNVAGSSDADYIQVVQMLSEEKGIAGFEINISCPNVRQGGITFGTDAGIAAALISKLRDCTQKPIITKLTPNVTDIAEIARAVVDAGSDALSLVNTFRGMAIDIEKQAPVLGNVFGGLSGPAIKPLALFNVYQVSLALKRLGGLNSEVPIIGMGGISTSDDAIEFILAGADAVSIGTANFIKPETAVDVLAGINEYCKRKNIKQLSEIKGEAQSREPGRVKRIDQP